MSRLATFSFAAILVLAPTLVLAQPAKQAGTGPTTLPQQNNSVTSGEPTTDQNNNAAPAARGATELNNDRSTSGQPTVDQTDMPPAAKAPATTAPVGGDYSHASRGSADRAMPQTAAGWVSLLAVGTIFAMAGIAVRRLAARS